MIAQVNSAAVVGLEVVPVTVEVDVSNGLPGLMVVGLPDKSVDESRERVKSAIRAAGATLPAQRITVNLAPADLRKEGPSFDLPMAAAILAATEQVPPLAKDCLLLGELSLAGEVKPVRGVLPIVSAAARRGIRTVFVPPENAPEARLVPEVSVYAVPDLQRLLDHLKDEGPLVPFTDKPAAGSTVRVEPDFSEIRGQATAKRALEIAAAGGHNVMLTGPPGTGKTLLAKALAGILPPLSYQETLEVTAIYSIAGLLPTHHPLVTVRPFRNPHHSISLAGLIGGG
jgi:magnesium chelatase family protein